MAWRILALALVAGLLAGCASSPVPSGPAAELDYPSRAATHTSGQVRVSTAVLSDQESTAVYGVPLASRSIQPVWIEVENRDDRAYYLLSPGLDPSFFPPSEAAEAFTAGGSREQRSELERRFRRLAFRNPVLPGTTSCWGGRGSRTSK